MQYFESQFKENRIISTPPLRLYLYNPFEFNPDLSSFNLKEMPNEIVYLDALLFAYYHQTNQGLDINLIDYLQALNEMFWKKAYFFGHKQLEKLEKLELSRNCNVLLSRFIIDHYKEVLLMKTINHPSDLVCNHLVEIIAKKLELTSSFGNDKMTTLMNILR